MNNKVTVYIVIFLALMFSLAVGYGVFTWQTARQNNIAKAQTQFMLSEAAKIVNGQLAQWQKSSKGITSLPNTAPEGATMRLLPASGIPTNLSYSEQDLLARTRYGGTSAEVTASYQKTDNIEKQQRNYSIVKPLLSGEFLLLRYSLSGLEKQLASEVAPHQSLELNQDTAGMVVHAFAIHDSKPYPIAKQTLSDKNWFVSASYDVPEAAISPLYFGLGAFALLGFLLSAPLVLKIRRLDALEQERLAHEQARRKRKSKKPKTPPVNTEDLPLTPLSDEPQPMSEPALADPLYTQSQEAQETKAKPQTQTQIQAQKPEEIDPEMQDLFDELDNETKSAEVKSTKNTPTDTSTHSQDISKKASALVPEADLVDSHVDSHIDNNLIDSPVDSLVDSHTAEPVHTSTDDTPALDESDTASQSNEVEFVAPLVDTDIEIGSADSELDDGNIIDFDMNTAGDDNPLNPKPLTDFDDLNDMASSADVDSSTDKADTVADTLLPRDAKSANDVEQKSNIEAIPDANSMGKDQLGAAANQLDANLVATKADAVDDSVSSLLDSEASKTSEANTHNETDTASYQLSPAQQSLFRAFDIRGDANLIDKAFVCLFAKALAFDFAKANATKAVIGYDTRRSSQAIAQQLAQVLQAQGITTVDIGLATTALVVFVTKKTAGAGVMITASHNGISQNGFKWFVDNAQPSREAVKLLCERLVSRKFNQPSATKGLSQSRSYDQEYLDAIQADIILENNASVCIDCLHGATAKFATTVFEEVGCTVVKTTNDNTDGNFTTGDPDPALPNRLHTLSADVVATNSDIGVAFDCDGDRLVAVDNLGRVLNGEQMLCLFAKVMLETNPAADIIFDAKCSRELNHLITAEGGRPVVLPTGSALLRQALFSGEYSAVFAGEYSGHYIFNDARLGQHDDGMYAALRLLEWLSEQQKTLAELVDELPKLVSTSDTYLTNTTGKPTRKLVAQMVEGWQSTGSLYVSGNNIILDTTDGFRLDFKKGFCVLRASNTSSAFSVRVGALDESAFEQIRTFFANLVKNYDAELAQAIYDIQPLSHSAPNHG